MAIPAQTPGAERVFEQLNDNLNDTGERGKEDLRA
jgi:hypothetical protein